MRPARPARIWWGQMNAFAGLTADGIAQSQATSRDAVIGSLAALDTGVAIVFMEPDGLALAEFPFNEPLETLHVSEVLLKFPEFRNAVAAGIREGGGEIVGAVRGLPNGMDNAPGALGALLRHLCGNDQECEFPSLEAFLLASGFHPAPDDTWDSVFEDLMDAEGIPTVTVRALLQDGYPALAATLLYEDALWGIINGSLIRDQGEDGPKP